MWFHGEDTFTNICVVTHREKEKFHWQCESFHIVVTSQVDECYFREAAFSLFRKDQSFHHPGFYYGIIKANKHCSATISASRVSIKLLIAGIPGASAETLFFMIIINVAYETVQSPDQIRQDPSYWWFACGMDNHSSWPDFSLSHKEVNVFIVAVS